MLRITAKLLRGQPYVRTFFVFTVTHTLIHTLPPTHLSSHPTLVPHSRTYVDTYMKDSNVYCGAGDVAVRERDVGADDDDDYVG